MTSSRSSRGKRRRGIMSEGFIQRASLPAWQGRERDCANLAAFLLCALGIAGILLDRIVHIEENFADAFKDSGDRKQQHAKQSGQGLSTTIQKKCRLACEFLLCFGHMLHSESSPLGHLSVEFFQCLSSRSRGNSDKSQQLETHRIRHAISPV
jgi:hypothetical protein